MGRLQGLPTSILVTISQFQVFPPGICREEILTNEQTWQYLVVPWLEDLEGQEGRMYNKHQKTVGEMNQVKNAGQKVEEMLEYFRDVGLYMTYKKRQQQLLSETTEPPTPTPLLDAEDLKNRPDIMAGILQFSRMIESSDDVMTRELQTRFSEKCADALYVMNNLVARLMELDAKAGKKPLVVVPPRVPLSTTFHYPTITPSHVRVLAAAYSCRLNDDILVRRSLDKSSGTVIRAFVAAGLRAVAVGATEMTFMRHLYESPDVRLIDLVWSALWSRDVATVDRLCELIRSDRREPEEKKQKKTVDGEAVNDHDDHDELKEQEQEDEEEEERGRYRYMPDSSLPDLSRTWTKKQLDFTQVDMRLVARAGQQSVLKILAAIDIRNGTKTHSHPAREWNDAIGVLRHVNKDEEQEEGGEEGGGTEESIRTNTHHQENKDEQKTKKEMSSWQMFEYWKICRYYSMNEDSLIAYLDQLEAQRFATPQEIKWPVLLDSYQNVLTRDGKANYGVSTIRSSSSNSSSNSSSLSSPSSLETKIDRERMEQHDVLRYLLYHQTTCLNTELLLRIWRLEPTLIEQAVTCDHWREEVASRITATHPISEHSGSRLSTVSTKRAEAYEQYGIDDRVFFEQYVSSLLPSPSQREEETKKQQQKSQKHNNTNPTFKLPPVVSHAYLYHFIHMKRGEYKPNDTSSVYLVRLLERFDPGLDMVLDREEPTAPVDYITETKQRYVPRDVVYSSTVTNTLHYPRMRSLQRPRNIYMSLGVFRILVEYATSRHLVDKIVKTAASWTFSCGTSLDDLQFCTQTITAFSDLFNQLSYTIACSPANN